MDDPIKYDTNSLGKKVHKGTMFVRMLFICIAVVVGFMFLTYASTAIAMKNAQYTVSLSEDGVSDRSLSLSETSDFTNPTVRLVCEGIDQMTNISGSDLPNRLHDLEGCNNGAHYIAYTFFLRNNGKNSVDIEESMSINSSILGADEAIRVRLYRNGTSKTYAKIGADGMPEYGTVPFNKTKVFETTTDGVVGGEVIKYTIVIWIEGDDPECLDNIRGGAVSLSMSFSIVEQESQDG